MLDVRRTATTAPDVDTAVAALRTALHDEPDAVLVFVSESYDLDALGPALRRTFPRALVAGCTDSGSIGPAGYLEQGISAVSLAGDIVGQSYCIQPLHNIRDDLHHIQRALAAEDQARPPGDNAFGLLFIDGLSQAEEMTAALLYTAIGSMPLIGGSAGDNRRFERTAVYFDGTFASDRAVLTVFRTPHQVLTFKSQNYDAGPTAMVITEADPEQRRVTEINGRPAAQAYAEALGVRVSDLDPDASSVTPTVLKRAGDLYVRSLQRVEPDGSLRFYCAIDRGVVLRVATPRDLPRSLRHELDRVHHELGQAPTVVIGCDCILRKVQAERDGCREEVGAIFRDAGVVGFSTYGEQFGPMHVNQTLVGIAIGGMRGP